MFPIKTQFAYSGLDRVGTVGDSQVYLESELFINLHFKNSVELVLFFKNTKIHLKTANELVFTFSFNPILYVTPQP